MIKNWVVCVYFFFGLNLRSNKQPGQRYLYTICIYIYLIMNEDEAKLEEKKEETAYLVSPEE